MLKKNQYLIDKVIMNINTILQLNYFSSINLSDCIFSDRLWGYNGWD